jgi:hypothetical protein
MNTSTSQTVVVADSATTTGDVFHALGWFTAPTIAGVIERHPEIREILLAELQPRLAATLEVNGTVYTVASAAETMATLYMRGKALHKATGQDNDFLDFMAEKGYININPEDAKNGACWLKPNDALVFVSLDEWFQELGLNRSRGTKGIWGLARLEDETVA